MELNFSLDEIREQALAFMRESGIYPIKDKDTRLIIDGQIHRYSIEGDKNGEKTGAYVIYTDGWPAGYFQNWRTGFKGNWKFNSQNITPNDYFQSPEYKNRQKELEALQRQRDEEAKKRKSEASERARILFDETEEATEHPYLKRKGVKAHGVHYRKDTKQLIIPLKNVDGNFLSIQSIDEDGNKRFFFDAPLEGAFFGFDLEKLKENPNTPVMLGEGFATMAKLHETTGYPAVAAMTCGSLMQVAHDLKKKYRCNIIITADNDLKTQAKTGKNPGLNAANKVKDKGLAVEVLEPPFKVDDAGSDWDDYIMRYGADDPAVKRLIASLKYWSLSKKEQALLDKVEIIDAQTLRNKNFPPLVWAVDGFLPAGLSVLAGGPKVGKSILSLHLSLAVAIGGCAFGKINVQQGDVLYLALEDTQRRLQERIEGSDLPENCDLSRLSLATRVPRQHEGGLEFIIWWLQRHKEARLVIIDTLQKFRKQLSGKNSMYSEDYDVVSEIKKIADGFSVPFLVVHHLKKAVAEDWINEISGSQGIAGAADTIFSLKRARTENGGILHRTGRDVEEKDFAMELDNYGWILKGEASEFTMPEWKKNIIDYLKENNSVTPLQLSQALNLSISNAKQSLRRLEQEGLIKKIGYGTYSLENYQR